MTSLNWRLFTAVIMIFMLLTVISAMIEGGGGVVSTTLTAALAADATEAEVADTTGFLSTGYVYIGTERIYYSNKTVDTFTLVADHEAYASGKPVYSETMGVANNLLGFNVSATSTNANFIDTGIEWGKGLFSAAFKIGTWDYAFFDNDIGTFMRIALTGFSVAFVVSCILLLRAVIFGG